MKPSNYDWSVAISIRITDEHDAKYEFRDDIDLLKDVLTQLFLENPWAITKLIGTGIIEEDYFDKEIPYPET
jgi:hypothetical protein